MCTSICIGNEENVDELQTKVQFYANILTLLHIIVDTAIFINFCTPEQFEDSSMEYYGFWFKILWIIQLMPITLAFYGAKKKKRNFLLPIIIILILLLVLISVLSVFFFISIIVSVVLVVQESQWEGPSMSGLLLAGSFVGLFISLGIDLAFLDMFVVTKNLYLLLRKEASMEPAQELYDINLEQHHTTELFTNDNNETSQRSNGAQCFGTNDAPQYVNLIVPSLCNATLDQDHTKPTQDLPPGYREIVKDEEYIFSQSPPTYLDAIKMD